MDGPDEADRAGGVKARLAAAKAAQQDGDDQAVRKCLEEARALTAAGGALAIDLFEADLLSAAGRPDDAEALLTPLLTTYPEDPWLHLRLAKLARDRGAEDQARSLLDRALTLDPAKKVAGIHLLHAEMLSAAGQRAEARAVLELLVPLFPNDPWLHLNLARLAHGRADAAAAWTHLDRARALDPDRRIPGIWLLSLDVLRGIGRSGQAEAELLQALEAEPGNAGLLERLFSANADAPGAAEDIERVLAHIPERALAGRLAEQALLAQKCFRQALPLMRRRTKRRGEEEAAHRLAAALLGAQQYRLALRYARQALRRWPDSDRLLDAGVRAGLAACDLDAVERMLDGLDAVADPTALARHRFMLAAHRNLLWQALDHYADLQQADAVEAGHRTALAALVYSWLAPADVPKLCRKLDLPISKLAGPTRAHLTLAGQQMIELDLEFQALSREGGHESPEAWVRARPGSTVAAVRLLADKRGTVRSQEAGDLRIPRRIVQYWWDRTAPPDDIAELLDSWKAARGFSYEYLTRADAVPYLRETLGPGWARAFGMAGSPAQQSSFLRLCLLADQGGIHAACDTRLTGRLESLLGSGRDLVLCREPIGATLDTNFIAAPPRHPALVLAAQQARQALLSRHKEALWNQSGPGLLTRAVAVFLAQAQERHPAAGLVIHDREVLTREVLLRVPLPGGAADRYWNTPRPAASDIWHKAARMMERTGQQAPR